MQRFPGFRMLCSFVGVCVVFVVGMRPAVASPPAHSDAPSSDVQFAAGAVCSFPVLIHYTVNGERATTFFDRTGAPRLVIITGQSAATVTNLDSGTSIDLHISGPARIVPQGDIVTVTLMGPSLLFSDLDHQLFTGNGRVVAQGTPQGVTFTNFQGNFVDLCAALA